MSAEEELSGTTVMYVCFVDDALCVARHLQRCLEDGDPRDHQPKSQEL
jgi:hypothetical protein